tara:strand:+ start:12668 stop:12994 length:327 start_codon:yes stop_codon:yes gene_type:complete
MGYWTQNKVDAWQRGFQASSFTECEYVSGQQLYGVWIDGFVAAGLVRKAEPSDVPVFVAGRIARLQGRPIDERPDTDLGPSWMRGWITQGELPIIRLAPEEYATANQI